MVEGDQRFGDPVAAPVLPEQIGFAHQQTRILEYVERMGEIGRPAAEITGDGTTGPIDKTNADAIWALERAQEAVDAVAAELPAG